MPRKSASIKKIKKITCGQFIKHGEGYETRSRKLRLPNICIQIPYISISANKAIPTISKSFIGKEKNYVAIMY